MVGTHANRDACRTRIDLLWCETRKERHGRVIRERLLTMNGMTTDMKQQCIGGGGGMEERTLFREGAFGGLDATIDSIIRIPELRAGS